MPTHDPNPSAMSAYAAAESAARHAYGRLIALLTSKTGDVESAEEALGAAFLSALETWPVRGVPDNPEGWLMTAARNRHTDARRRETVRHRHAAALRRVAELQLTWTHVPDRRLRLMFLCAHPAIDPAVRAPLMLQTVLGLTAERIGRAFGVAPTTMGQRLSRAKKKIARACIPFDLSDASLEPDRLAVVCESLYAAFTAAYHDRDHNLADEAVFLAQLALEQSNHHPETAGLLSLMVFIHARRDARRDDRGRYIPVDAQDTRRWDGRLIQTAERLLAEAAAKRAPGRFQLEAAIQSAHAARLTTAASEPDWHAIEVLYRELLEHLDTPGVRIAHAAAVLNTTGPAAALAILDAWPGGYAHDLQPYWALRAKLERELGLDDTVSRTRAIDMTDDPAVEAFLRHGD